MARVLALAGLLLLLTAVVTYPQITHFNFGVHDFGDPLLNAWALCWVPHALATQPLSLFDANIFYPQQGTLAFSETLVAPALLVAPQRALGAGGILLHNVTLFSGYVVSGLSMFALVRYLLVHERYYLRGGFEDDIAQLARASRLALKATFQTPTSAVRSSTK